MWFLRVQPPSGGGAGLGSRGAHTHTQETYISLRNIKIIPKKRNPARARRGSDLCPGEWSLPSAPCAQRAPPPRCVRALRLPRLRCARSAPQPHMPHIESATHPRPRPKGCIPYHIIAYRMCVCGYRKTYNSVVRVIGRSAAPTGRRSGPRPGRPARTATRHACLPSRGH